MRVLLIEDDKSIAGLEKRHLEKGGFKVLVASSGKEGIERIRREDINLLVIDYKLPDMSGVDVMQKVNEMGKHIPSIIVTGTGNENIAVTAMKLGALDYIVKDKDSIKRLTATCNEALRKFNLEEENRSLIRELKLVNTELLEANRKLDEISKLDDLTEVYNRRYLLEALEYEVWRAKRYLCPLSFAIFDLDRFKEVNDSLGHPAGDAVLKQFAFLLRSSMRKTDIVGRYGGEEFGVILSGTTISRAVVLCNRLRENVSKASFGPEGRISLTASVGLSTLTGEMEPEALIAEADRSLYAAKNAGRNCVLALQKDAAAMNYGCRRAQGGIS